MIRLALGLVAGLWLAATYPPAAAWVAWAVASMPEILSQWGEIGRWALAQMGVGW